MNIRDIRQKEAADSFGNQGILKAAPRFGKIKTSINIMQNRNPSKVLICFPRVDIGDGWKNDFKFWNWEPISYTFTTFKSLYKHDPKDYDFLIIDEIHEASRKQLQIMKNFVVTKMPVLGLSGTITFKTEREIFYYADLALFYDYSIERAVNEGILSDYQINVHFVPLGNKPSSKYKDKNGKALSEKVKFDRYMWVLGNHKVNTPSFFHTELKVINFLQNSDAKWEHTMKLLNEYKDERVLVFCGTTQIADTLGIPVYHSKAREKKVFDEFCSGIGNHLATIKMAQAGVTIKPINRGIINYTSGNPEDAAQKICRFLGIEYNSPDKKADIHIICSDESFEKLRISSALQFFDNKKIKYLYHGGVPRVTK